MAGKGGNLPFKGQDIHYNNVDRSMSLLGSDKFMNPKEADDLKGEATIFGYATADEMLTANDGNEYEKKPSSKKAGPLSDYPKAP